MALSANTNYQLRNTAGKSKDNRVIKTGAKIYQGAILAINRAGRVYPAANDTTGRYIGVAAEECLTGNGTRRVEIYDNCEALLPLKTSVTQGMNNTIMYAFDDAAGTNLATLGPQIGRLSEFVSANLGWVALRQPALNAAS